LRNRIADLIALLMKQARPHDDVEVAA
jgi:hypothetical protein